MANVNEKKKVLVVDDNEMELLVAKAILKDEYEIFIAKSGKETLEYFFNGLIPDLILLDILMPNMDGWETFNRIRAISLLQDIPIAFLTSLVGTADEKRALEMGAADYIMKPYEKKDLLNRIKNILKKSEIIK
jgi:CheY-like chemotaxis protein